MKAFIVLALVACVAARSLDIDTLRLLSKEKSLLTKDDLLLNKLTNTHRFTVPKKALLNSVYDFDYNTVPTTTFDDVESYNYNPYSWTQRRVSIVSLEELVSHPLFREYLQIPLFRQFWEQYPTVFRRYVESPLFQQFWTVPQFQQYFRNPIFFYKYIFPQIQVIAQSTEGVYDYGYNYDTVGDYTRRPFTHSRDVLVGDYLNKILSRGGVEHRRTFYPFSKYDTPYSTVFGHQQQWGQQYNTGVNYKFLLDKIYRTLFVNKPVVGEVTQVRTDVKVAPAHEKVVVEPITGETKVVVEQPKIVDVKVDEKIISQTGEEVEGKLAVKEAILKRLLVSKHISLELYQVLKNLPLHHVKEIVRRIAPSVFSDIDTVFGNDVEDVTYPYNYVRGNDVEDVVYRQKINQIISQLYNNEIVGDRYNPVVRDLLKTLGHHENTIYNRDIPTTFEDIVRRV